MKSDQITLNCSSHPNWKPVPVCGVEGQSLLGYPAALKGSQGSGAVLLRGLVALARAVCVHPRAGRHGCSDLLGYGLHYNGSEETR